MDILIFLVALGALFLFLHRRWTPKAPPYEPWRVGRGGRPFQPPE